MRSGILFTLFAFFMLMIVGCSNDDEHKENGTLAKVNVSIKLTIGGGEKTTRATSISPDDNPNINIENGLAYEDYIAPDDIELLVYGQDEKLVEKIDLLFLGSSNDGGSDATEEYTCLVNGSINNITKQDIESGKMFHLVALCNIKGTLKGSAAYDYSTLSNLISSLKYDGYDNTFTSNLISGTADINQTTRIPMWGICTTGLTMGELTNVEICVLRTMTKVRVRLADELTGYTLTGITMNRANKGGTLAAQTMGGAPQAYTKRQQDGNNVYATTWNNATETPIKYASPYNGGLTGGELAFTEKEENGKQFWVIYVPEYNHIADVINSSTETGVQEPAYMTLTIKDKNNITVKFDEQLPVLHFSNYSASPNPTAPQWDLIRNEIHEYIITGIVGADGLTTEVRVIKWFGYRHPGIVM